MSFSNTDEEILPAGSPEAVPVETESEASSEGAVVSGKTEIDPAIRKKFNITRKNGLSLAVALATVARGEAVPAAELVWENPLEDSLNVRERKLRTAEDLGTRFPKTQGALSRAAGTIAAFKWTEQWQKSAEAAAAKFVEAAVALGEASADFAVATGLIPSGGTVRAIADLQKLIGALLAVRGEDSSLVLERAADATLSRLRDAASLAENCARHESLLSLPYPEKACENESLESWLKLWNEAAFSCSFPRWMKRRKVVSALRKLANCPTQSPLDPRVDLGNLIAVRVCKAEFAQKFSDLAEAFPQLLPGMKPCGALVRIAALEKARRAVASALEQLASVPEKCEAWAAVFARWLRGNDVAFAKSGSVEKAFEKTGAALAAFGAARESLAEILGADISVRIGETPETAGAFAEALLADKELWRDVCAWNSAALSAGRRGMGTLAAAVRAGTIEAADAKRVFETEYCRRWSEAVLEVEGLSVEDWNPESGTA
ncbi:MAG: hypothetical protein J6L64_00700 [Opitutales bacterium]|nr:hypothetical protein [Opitutales bacterium]